MVNLKRRALYSPENRRDWGCDNCRNIVATERFEGYVGTRLWICSACIAFILREKGK